MINIHIETYCRYILTYIQYIIINFKYINLEFKKKCIPNLKDVFKEKYIKKCNVLKIT